MFYFKYKKILAVSLSTVFLFVFFMPVVSSAAIIECGNSVTDGGITTIPNPCTFADFVATINRVINWFISIAGVIFTISAIWGGFLYMTSGQNPGNKAKAKSILWSTLIGFVIILTSWLIVYTLLTYLVPDNSSVFNFIK